MIYYTIHLIFSVLLFMWFVYGITTSIFYVFSGDRGLLVKTILIFLSLYLAYRIRNFLLF